MVENIRLETQVAFANTGLAGQRTPLRFPRKQAIRSLYFNLDLGLDIDTAVTEVLSSLEMFDTIEILYDERVIRVRGDEIAAVMAMFFGVPPIVGAASYLDAAVADNQDADAVFRIPVGCTAAPDKNITINVSLSGEAAWSETVANTPADLDSILYVFADYVDAVEVEYATWDDRRLAVAAQLELTPTESYGSDIVGVSIICRDDDDLYTADGTASTENTIDDNYEDALTLVRFVMGEMTHDVQTIPDLLQLDKPVNVMRRAGLNRPNLLHVPGAYVLMINLKVTALPRLIINAGTSDVRVLMWFATPAREQSASPPTPSTGRASNEQNSDTQQRTGVSPGTTGGRTVGGGSGVLRRGVRGGRAYA